MKLEPLFTSKENSLFAIDGNVVSMQGSTVIQAKGLCASSPVPECNKRPLLVQIFWEDIGMDESSYNEEFLACLRDFLKVLDEQNIFAVIVPCTKKTSLSQAEKDNFTASCKHCARRIKDCRSVIGFAIPEQVDTTCFMDELSQKHAHYIYFSKSDATLTNSSIVKY